MKVLGLSGGFGLLGEDCNPNLPPWFFHDAAAVIVDGVQVLAAVEEERLTRVKHVNTFPLKSVRKALQSARIARAEIEHVAFFFSEPFATAELKVEALENPTLSQHDGRALVKARLFEALELPIGDHALTFVPHHLAHATAALVHSGFDDALVLVVDGNSEDASLSAYSAACGRLKLIRSEPANKSFGHLYTVSTQALGFSRFDEYKVMGLAPYGDPTRYKLLFDRIVQLS